MTSTEAPAAHLTHRPNNEQVRCVPRTTMSLDLVVDAMLAPYLREMLTAPKESMRNHFRYGALTRARRKRGLCPWVC